MDYVNIGVIDKKKKKTTVVRKGLKETPKLKKNFLQMKPPQRKNFFSHLPRITAAALILGSCIFLLYSFFPQIKSWLQSMLQGPTTVMSFIKDQPQSLKQDDNVTNILLVGIDKRSVIPYTYETSDGQQEKNGFLADTLIVLSYNHQDQSVVMLSLPRDLWVEIPAFNTVYTQSTRINAAYSLGDMYNYPGGGLALTKEVISEILGMPIHYSARVDFEGFCKAIDLLGGVDINVENTFDDWQYPLEGYENAPLDQRYIHLHFDAGVQHMDGETALRYARSRKGTNSEGSDFARAKRQQKVIMAVQGKASNLNILENLPKILEWNSVLGETLQTDVEPSEALLAYKLGKNIDPETIRSYVLDNGDGETGILYHPPEEEFGGAWILLPQGNNWDLVQEFCQKIFYSERLPIETVPADNPEIDNTLQ